jgi:xylulokinase
LHDPKARGVVFGLSLKHTRGDVYRAILESVGFGIRHNVTVMREEGLNPERIIAVGGGTQNDLWMQLVADIVDIELIIPQQLIGASYGDAFMAAVGIGRFKDLTEITRWVKSKKVVSPNLAAHKLYTRNYKIFRALYESNRSLMHDLADSIRSN